MADSKREFKEKEALLGKIWEKLLPTLGSITLAALFRRILRKVSSLCPAFSSISVTENGFNFAEIEKSKKDEFEKGFSLFISELTTFLSEMTGEILISEIEEIVKGSG
ncbi:MAG: hypothetical protein QME07_04360 [bacterium]|nr:hypothetical protein [bacterium]